MRLTVVHSWLIEILIAMLACWVFTIHARGKLLDYSSMTMLGFLSWYRSFALSERLLHYRK